MKEEVEEEEEEGEQNSVIEENDEKAGTWTPANLQSYPRETLVGVNPNDVDLLSTLSLTSSCSSSASTFSSLSSLISSLSSSSTSSSPSTYSSLSSSSSSSSWGCRSIESRDCMLGQTNKKSTSEERFTDRKSKSTSEIKSQRIYSTAFLPFSLMFVIFCVFDGGRAIGGAAASDIGHHTVPIPSKLCDTGGGACVRACVQGRWTRGVGQGAFMDAPGVGL